MRIRFAAENNTRIQIICVCDRRYESLVNSKSNQNKLVDEMETRKSTFLRSRFFSITIIISR